MWKARCLVTKPLTVLALCASMFVVGQASPWRLPLFQGGSLPHGRFVPVGMNEVSLQSFVEDGPAYRLSAQFGGTLGKISANRLEADGSETELAMILFAEDQRYPGAGGGEIGLLVQRPGTKGDAGMVRVMTIHWDGIEFHAPAVVPHVKWAD